MKIVLKANQVWESKEKGGLTLKIIGHFHVFSVGNKKDVRYACINHNNNEITYKENSLKAYIKRNNMILKDTI